MASHQALLHAYAYYRDRLNGAFLGHHWTPLVPHLRRPVMALTLSVFLAVTLIIVTCGKLF